MSTLAFRNILFVPSIHQRMAFADEVRRAAAEFRPDCVAVELPPAVERWFVRGVLRLPRLSSVCYPSEGAPGEMIHIPVDPADSMTEGVRLALEHELELAFIDGAAMVNLSLARLFAVDLPDDLMIERTGLEAYVAVALPYLASVAATPEDLARERFMAFRLAELAGSHERVLCVVGMAHYARVRRGVEWLLAGGTSGEPPPATPIRGVTLADLAPKSIQEVTREIPWLVWRRELAREEMEFDGTWRFDKLAALPHAIREVCEKYRETYKTEISLTRLKALIQFTRNLAIVRGRLQPSAYEMAIGGNGVVDGDFGYELWQLLRTYPPQMEDEATDLPRMTLRGDRGTLSDREEKCRMRCYFDRPCACRVSLRFRRRPNDAKKKKWKESWNEEEMRGICSWPPEDEAQEKFMAHLRKRALQVLSEDKKQVVEFSTSFMDGLDIRQTMRNWHTQKLFVQQTPQPQGECAAVVLILDDAFHDAAYPWRLTLYAENQNESDIAFYATPPGDNVVGPRISRTEFGGLLSIYPARQIPDIWGVPGIELLKTCAEKLLAGAILFTHERFIAHIDDRPPSPVIRELAARHGKKIVHLPRRNFSREQLKKIRKFHILKGRDVRNYAADYIFE